MRRSLLLTRAFSVRKTPMIIDGKPVVSSSSTWYDIHNPATQEVVATVPESTPAELRRAVESSQKAFKSFREVSPQQRARIMMKFHTLLDSHRDEVGHLC